MHRDGVSSLCTHVPPLFPFSVWQNQSAVMDTIRDPHFLTLVQSPSSSTSCSRDTERGRLACWCCVHRDHLPTSTRDFPSLIYRREPRLLQSVPVTREPSKSLRIGVRTTRETGVLCDADPLHMNNPNKIFDPAPDKYIYYICYGDTPAHEQTTIHLMYDTSFLQLAEQTTSTSSGHRTSYMHLVLLQKMLARGWQ